ncbi:unnamed protein product [Pleuronectes platessa]|uniref:Uncharacterized protein n=1 Tax=Pleuronectes platessa TaxID=8262 RepID=A0A9N7TXZ8_PLEPL|nr:unnamed protein product [Pleuronectes platessa]
MASLQINGELSPSRVALSSSRLIKMLPACGMGRRYGQTACDEGKSHFQPWSLMMAQKDALLSAMWIKLKNITSSVSIIGAYVSREQTEELQVERGDERR